MRVFIMDCWWEPCPECGGPRKIGDTEPGHVQHVAMSDLIDWRWAV